MKFFICNFIQFHVKKKMTLIYFVILGIPRILQYIRGRAISMLNAGMTMDDVAMNTGCPTDAIRHLRQHFQATWRTSLTSARHDACQRPLYSEHSPAQAHPNWHRYRCKYPWVHILTVYLPKLCASTCARVGYLDVNHTLVVFWGDAVA
jgi:hypothetical protein